MEREGRFLCGGLTHAYIIGRVFSVDRMGNGLAVDVGIEIGHGGGHHRAECGAGEGGVVGREDAVVQRLQGVVGGQRFMGVNVQTRAVNTALLQRVVQRGLVHDAAAAGVDQHEVRLDLLQGLGVDEVAGGIQ